MNNETHVKKCIALLMAAYPRQEFPEPSQRLYIKMLADLPGDLLEAAVMDIISKNTFLPSISELRAAVNTLVEKSSGRLDAYTAWDTVCRQIRRVGSYGIPDLDDLTAKAVAGVGGWQALCRSENQVADRARFFQVYDAFLSRERDNEMTLPGVRELISGMTAKMLAEKSEGGK